MPHHSSRRDSLRLLRALIREAAFSAGDATEEMALAIIEDGDEKVYVLYDSGMILNSIEAWKEESLPAAEEEIADYVASIPPDKLEQLQARNPQFRKLQLDAAVLRMVAERVRSAWLGRPNAESSPIVGMINVESNPGPSSPQWGASTIKLSAAKPGWGPFLYDVVMSAEGGIVSDRESVSDSARRVWQYYKDSRPDVKAKPLDDITDPKTPSTRDDVEGYYPDGHVEKRSMPPRNPLNYAYFSQSGPDLGGLEARHREVEGVLDHYRIPLDMIAKAYFGSRWRQ